MAESIFGKHAVWEESWEGLNNGHIGADSKRPGRRGNCSLRGQYIKRKWSSVRALEQYFLKPPSR